MVRKSLTKWHISAQCLILLAAVYFSIVLNGSLWRFIWQFTDANDVKSLGLIVAFAVVLSVVFVITFSLVLVKYVTKPLLILLLILASIANYAMLTYGIFIDSDMFRNVAETDYYEVTNLITASAIFWVGVTGALPIVLVLFTDIDYKPLKQEIKTRLKYIGYALLLIMVLVGAGYKDGASFLRNHSEIRKLINPFNCIYSVGKYYRIEALKNRKFLILDNNPQLMLDNDKSPKVVVLVVGETARAADFSLYGYDKNTNPYLSDENIVTFKNMSSCGTATAVSLPCIFAATKHENFKVSDALFTQNLLDIVALSGYRVIWIENNSGCKGVCNRVEQKNIRVTNNPKWCKNGYCYDEILVEELNKQLSNIKGNTLIIMHMIGSHGPAYFERYPKQFKKFTPTCDTSDLTSCSREQINNTYDNTILYTDYVLDKMIKELKTHSNYQSALLYVSDHGESLGENNIYLHGLPYFIAPDYQTKVPFIMWLSGSLIKADNIDMLKLQNEAENVQASHDNVFHTMLNLLKIKSKTYDEKLDLIKAAK